jgi:hypothetical protein
MISQSSKQTILQNEPTLHSQPSALNDEYLIKNSNSLRNAQLQLLRCKTPLTDCKISISPGLPCTDKKLQTF